MIFNIFKRNTNTFKFHISLSLLSISGSLPVNCPSWCEFTCDNFNESTSLARTSVDGVEFKDTFNFDIELSASSSRDMLLDNCMFLGDVFINNETKLVKKERIGKIRVNLSCFLKFPSCCFFVPLEHSHFTANVNFRFAKRQLAGGYVFRCPPTLIYIFNDNMVDNNKTMQESETIDLATLLLETPPSGTRLNSDSPSPLPSHIPLNTTSTSRSYNMEIEESPTNEFVSPIGQRNSLNRNSLNIISPTHSQRLEQRFIDIQNQIIVDDDDEFFEPKNT
eukprot:TRINITY_DN1819_c0_g2_i1.p1 TRINITY_DN1819_c0_g2~~TRINITY_DN1819_c0_g2_i1.p1  ORF type:complete len:278 (+),score=65.93 TRINITY_DN1819_c0_g2_i1:53-886(+)